MADAQRVVELIFKGVDQTAAATQAALGNVEKFSGSLQDATQPFADFTAGALKVEAAMLAVGAAFVAFSINESVKFNGALLDLQKVLSDSDQPLQEFADAANKISLEYGTAADDVLQSIANFKQAGFDGAEALQLVRSALDLKIAGDVEAARASDLLVASLKGFKLEASESTRVVDLLNEVSNNYATNVNELAEGFARVSPVAKAAGLSLEETAGLLTPGIEVFRSGSEVANALRTTLLRLVDDSKPVREALDYLKVSQYNANGELRSARDIYFDVAAALSQVEGGQKTFIASQLAGIEQSAKFIAITDGLATTLKIAGDGFNYAGSAAKEVEIRLASAGIQAEKAVQAFLGLARTVGDPLLDEFSGIANAIQNIFASVGESVKATGFGGLEQYLEDLFRQLQAAFEEIAKNLPEALAGADLSRFQEGIQVVLDAVKDLFGGIDLTTVEGLRAGIETLGTAFLGLGQFSAGVIESFKPLITYMLELGSGVREMDTSFLQTLGNIGGFATQLNLLAGGINGLIPIVEAFIAVLTVKSGLSLLGSLGAVAPAVSAVVTTLIGPVGLVAALGAAAIAGTAYAVSQGQVEEAQAKTAAASEVYKEKTDQLNAKLKELSDALGLPITSYEKFEELLSRGVIVWDETTNNWARAADSLTELGAASEKSWAEIDKSNQALLAASEAGEKAALANDKLATASEAAVDKQRGWKAVIDETTGAIIGYEQVFVKAGETTNKFTTNNNAATESAKKIAQAAKDAAEAQYKWNLEMEKLQTAEKLKLIESATAITTARIQADASTMVASFESINTTIQSTGDLIGKLTGQLSGDLDWSQMRIIEEQLRLENERRQQALELQKQQVQKQIELIQARIEALQRGDALIQVDGAGLQPHLEAFMFEILQAIQVKVNQDGLELLLGA